MILTGETEELGEKTLSQFHFFNVNPICTEPSANSGLCGDRPATNRLSHGTTLRLYLLCNTVYGCCSVIVEVTFVYARNADVSDRVS
jgi:hypothetical protein